MSTSANEKTYAFRIKVCNDSQNNESIIEKLKGFIFEQRLEYTIKEITDSKFDDLNDDFWNYTSDETTLFWKDDKILMASPRAQTKPIKKIVDDLNKCANVQSYKYESKNGNPNFFFPFCTEGNKVFAKKLDDFISASNPETVILSADGNICKMEIALEQNVGDFCKDIAWNNESNNAAQCFSNLIRTEGNKDYPTPQICSYEFENQNLTISWEIKKEETKNEKQ